MLHHTVTVNYVGAVQNIKNVYSSVSPASMFGKHQHIAASTKG